MERAVIYCLCITCVTGAVLHEKMKSLKEQDLIILPGDELMAANKQRFEALDSDLDFNIKKDSKKYQPSLKDSIVKIDERDLYENGQDAKENNERSFVIINQKFKSQRFDPRPLPQKSFFDESPQHFDAFSVKVNPINNEERIQATHQNELPNIPSYSYQISRSYFTSVPVAAHTNAKGEFVELLKRPLIRPVATPSNRTSASRQDKDFFRSRDEELHRSHLFNNNVDDSGVSTLASENQLLNGRLTVQRQIESNELMRQKLLIANDINPVPHKSFEDDAKLDSHIRSTLRDEIVVNEHENRYNCYNENCKAVLNKHNKILNNGIKLGLRCLCEESFLRDRSGVSNSLKDNSVHHGNSTAFTDSEEAVVNETAKLITLADEIENTI